MSLTPPDGFANKVCVTDGETRQALALARSLGGRGIRVEVLAARRGSLAGGSRFTAAEHIVPDVVTQPGAWAEAVRQIMTRTPESLLIPTTEESLGTLQREGLTGCMRVATPSRRAYEIACDKARLLECGARAGFDVPTTVLVESVNDLNELPAGLAFPVLIKARRSRFFEGGRWQKGSAARLDDQAALERARNDPGLRGGALLQPFVPGRGEGLFVAADRGRVVAAFAHRRLREKPPTGGVGVLLESSAPQPGLLESAKRLIAELDWHGVAMLEFRREPTGRSWLIELNPRLWGSLQLAIDSGADFPGLVLALHAGAPLPEFAPRAGVRMRWFLGDLDCLLILLRRSEVRRRLGSTRLSALADFLRGFWSAQDEVFRWSDARPFANELRAWAEALRGDGTPS